MNLLTQGLRNWKLRLILSALLCIMGLGAMISMILGLFIELSVYDKSIVSIAIFMVGIPTYLILSGLAKIDEYTIVRFLNDQVPELSDNPEVLMKLESELNDTEKTMKEHLIQIFKEKPVYSFLPDKPVKQAYFLLLASMVISFFIWFLG
tara:strand:+ start:17939 stop:18388 length:450 start_codon:yes stop_codon:yes gene_type:complete